MRWMTRGVVGLGPGVGGSGGARRCSAPPSPRDEPRKPQIPELKVEKYTLPNGLTVILHEDHKTPVVAVNIWYKVGSKDEKPGRTGFAHLFEHMMFQGSKHHDEDYFGPLEKLGAEINGTTDRGPDELLRDGAQQRLELALWLESDRMGFLLPAMTQEKLDNQRDVVKNERRQTVDNVPYGQAEEVLLEALYPAGHPYHHSVIGSMADLSAARLADVAAFFRTYYIPNNAILCVAGDFEPAQARHGSRSTSAPCRAARRSRRSSRACRACPRPKHIRLTDAVSLPRAQLVWPTVPANHPDEPALDVLAAVLGGLAKENRLFRALMYDRQLAAQVDASHPTQLLVGHVRGRAVCPARPEARRAGQDRRRRDRAAQGGGPDRRRGEQGPERAGERADHGAPVGDPQGQLPQPVHGHARRSAGLPDRDRQGLRRHAGRRQAGGQTVPRGRGGSSSTSCPAHRRRDRPRRLSTAPKQAPLANPPLAEVKDNFDRSMMPKLGPTPQYIPPPFERRTALERSGAADRRAARAADRDLRPGRQVGRDPRRPGQGGAGLDRRQPARRGNENPRRPPAGRRAGRDRRFAGRRRRAGIDHRQPDHADAAPGPGLDLYADVLLNPSFPEKELKRLKLQRLAQLKARADDPEQTAEAVFPRLIYGLDHPYGRPDLGTPALGPVDHPRRRGRVLQADHGARQRRAGGRRRHAARCDHGRARSAVADWKPGPVPQPPSLAPPPAPADAGRST